jgi:hypothetical protein
MKAVALLSELLDRGVTLTVEGENLRCRAPKGRLTPELRQSLVECKAEILQFAATDPWAVYRLQGVKIIGEWDYPLCRYKNHLAFWRRPDKTWCCQTCHPSPWEDVETFEWWAPPVTRA